MSVKNKERGDTLIEVLIALTVLSVVVVGAIALMNRGVTQMYDNMERAEVRLLIERQVELLTYARDEYLASIAGSTSTNANAVALWVSIRNAPSVSSVPALDNCSDTSQGFSLQGSASTAISLSGVAQASAAGFPSSGNGMWIQKIQSTTAAVPFIDFYIRACWIQNSRDASQVESSVVRLYEK